MAKDRITCVFCGIGCQMDLRVSRDVKIPGSIFIPFHESPVNELTNDALDPISKIPELKILARRVGLGDMVYT